MVCQSLTLCLIILIIITTTIEICKTMKQPAIYIMSNKRNGTLYVGAKSDLIKRVYEHKDDSTIRFTARLSMF